MIYIHPSQLHNPLQIAALELRTGLRAESRRGRAVLVSRRSDPPPPPMPRLPRIDWTMSDYQGEFDPKGAA